jgi:hypothetical protein
VEGGGERERKKASEHLIKTAKTKTRGTSRLKGKKCIGSSYCRGKLKGIHPDSLEPKTQKASKKSAENSKQKKGRKLQAKKKEKVE